MGICEGLELPSTLPVERKLEGALDPHLSGLLSLVILWAAPGKG